MQKKILFISEALDAPFDEGIKNIVFSLYKQFETDNNIISVTRDSNNTDGIRIKKTRLNRFFLKSDLKSIMNEFAPDVILYVPVASCSFYSLIRVKRLKMMQKGIKVVVLCVQNREYSKVKHQIASKFLKPDLMLLLGKRDSETYLNMGIKLKILPPAIDTVKFSPSTEDEKNRIRAKYGIPSDRKVVLHVGHIRENRNLECFFDIQEQDNTQVVIVASSTWGKDISLRKSLTDAGVRIIDNFLPDMSIVYKMSDIYVFPVISKSGATEMPLSVLEAMACNLKVLTSRYGGLVDFFTEDTDFRYFHSVEELIEMIRDTGENNKISNYKKIEDFTWERFANEVVSACNGAV